MNEEIVLETIQPIATDEISQQVLDDLKADGIRFQNTEDTMLMNLFIVGSTEGLQKVPSAMGAFTKKAFKNVVVFMNPSLDTEEIENIYAFINFGDRKDIHEAIKQFLCHYQETIEVHSLVGYDFRSFIQIIEGHNTIEIKSFDYTIDISEALTPLRAISIPKGSKCLLFFTQHEVNEQHTLEVANEYMESIFKDIDYVFSFNTSSHLHASLLIAIPFCIKHRGNIFEKFIKIFKK